MLRRYENKLPLGKSGFVVDSKGFEALKKLDEGLIYSDLILLLLSISPIYGNTRFQKEVFLTWKEVFYEISLDPVYYPWRFGAYSSVVQDAATLLENEGLIRIRKYKGKGTSYYITVKGENEIKQKISKFKIDLSKLKMKKEDWEEWTHEGIKKYVYRNYPEYTYNSQVPAYKW